MIYQVRALDNNGSLHIRIESIQFNEVPNGNGYFGENFTYFQLGAVIEVWNELSEAYIFEHSDGCKFKANVQFLSPLSFIYGQNYYPMGCNEAITPVQYNPGISIETIVGGVAFDRPNITTLPHGVYRVYTDLLEWNSGDVGYNLGVNITIDSQGTHILFDNKPTNWGSTSTNGSIELSLNLPIVVATIGILLYLYEKKYNNLNFD